jgi:protein TonB
VAQISAALERDNADRAAALLRQAEASAALKSDQVARFRADIDRQQADTRVKRFAGEIDQRIRDGRLVEPANDSAKYYLGQLRKLPNAAAAGDAQQRALQNAVLDEARAAGQRKQTDALERWLGEARKLGVSPARISAVRREARPAAAAAPAPASDVSRLAALVQTRIDEGRLLEPAQDSALYQLGQLRAVDVAGTQYATSARALSDRLLERGRGAVGERKPDIAQNYAAAARQVGVNEAGVAALERDVAQLRSAGATPTVSNDQIKRTRYIAPEYPREAMFKNIEGSVKVRFTIDSDGKVSEAFVVSSTPDRVFDKAALNAVRRWRFEPLAVAGEPAQATIETTVVFKIAADATP